MSEAVQKKKWYQRPENVLVYGGLAGAGYLALNVMDTVLPLLNRVLESAMYTAVLAGGLGILGFLAVNKDFHRLAWYGYTSLMRFLTGQIVELDPIGVMRGYVKKLRKNLEDIGGAIASLKGQARELEQKIREKGDAHEKSMSMASVAKRQGKGGEAQLRLLMRKGKRAEDLGLTYQGLLNKVRKHVAVMEKIQEAANFMVVDIEDTVEAETEKRKMIHASYKAMDASRRILAENQQREMYDLAMESVTKDYYSKLGEIEQFMDDTKGFIGTMDLENGAYDAEALTKLEKWEARSAALLEGGTGSTKYRVNPAFSLEAQEDGEDGEQVGVEKRQSYADLFEKLDT